MHANVHTHTHTCTPFPRYITHSRYIITYTRRYLKKKKACVYARERSNVKRKKRAGISKRRILQFAVATIPGEN